MLLMLYGEEAEGRLGSWGFGVVGVFKKGVFGVIYRPIYMNSLIMLHIKIHEPYIFDARKINFLIKRI
jgi:hypothetical protein